MSNHTNVYIKIGIRQNNTHPSTLTFALVLFLNETVFLGNTMGDISMGEGRGKIIK